MKGFTESTKNYAIGKQIEERPIPMDTVDEVVEGDKIDEDKVDEEDNI